MAQSDGSANLERIQWDKMAEQFLRLHGWSQDPENPFNPLAWGHPAFPIMEDVSEDGPLKFVEEFYGLAWTTHRAYIEGAVILSFAETEGEDDE